MKWADTKDGFPVCYRLSRLRRHISFLVKMLRRVALPLGRKQLRVTFAEPPIVEVREFLVGRLALAGPAVLLVARPRKVGPFR